MKRILKVLTFILIAVADSTAQQHPVQVNVTLQPPYSLSLADYVAPGTDRVNLTLLLNDLNRPTYQARLRLTIEGLGITLRTRETFISQPIMLQGGIPTFVGATELAPYFNPQNIDFAGFTRQQYQSAGRLPEGLYRVCIEVLDYNRGNVVSNQGCTMAWMMLNDPPLLNQPQNHTKVIATEPQNVMFNWTPRHTASPNAAHSVEYLFRLVEVYPETRNPMEAMRVSRPIYETYTTATSLYYGVAEPNLIPGRTYAWQLQARDTEGRDLFKNQGYSEIFSFQFGDPCDVPASLEANVLSDKAIRLGWQPGFNHTAFRAEYRPVGGEGHWYSSESYLDYLNVDGLRPDTEYEVRLRGHCGTLQGAFTPTRRVRTAQASEQEFACGAGSVIPINNTLPQMQLFEGQTIDAQGFKVRLTEVTGSNGRFSGAGYATVPFLANAKVRVTFDDIFVNEDLQMVRGTIRTVYNPDSPFMVDGDKVQEKVKEMLAPKPKTWGDDFNGDTVRIMEPVAKVDISADGSTILIITESGVTIEKPVGDEMLIVDSEGNETIVREDGTIEKPGGLITRPGGGSAGDPPQTDNPKLKDLELPLVEFAPVQDQKYGFDKQEQQALAGKYETTEIRGSPYSVPWKSVEVGRTDDLVAEHARINDKQATGAVKFKTLATNLPGMKTGEGEYRLSVTGSFHGNEEELFAVYVQKDTVNDTEDETQLGKLKVVSYEKAKKSLMIVPVNDAGAKYNLNTLAAQINGIYRQAVAEFDVRVENPVRIETTEWDRNGDGAIDDDKGMLANYTKEMNALVKAYERHGKLDKEAYYVFLVQKSENDRAGYMPYKQQVGFIFTESISSDENLAVTIAHELGHGAFHLKHIFEEYALGQSTTDNLMDYRRGTRLHKYQWDEVHDPQARMNWFKGDEEFAYSPWTAVENGFLVNTIPGVESDDIVSFLSPTGMIYSLPGRVRDVTFDPQTGFLLAFTIDNERYLGFKKTSHGITEFIGYRADLSKQRDGTYSLEGSTSKGYPDHYSTELSEPLVYYVLNYRDSKCGEANLFLNEYRGKPAKLEDNYGFLASDPSLAKGKDASDFVVHLSDNYQVVASIFDCLEPEVKFLYKFIEYVHSENYSDKKLNELATALTHFDVLFEGFYEGDSDYQYPLDLQSLGAVNDFKDWAIKNRNVEEGKKPKLLIRLLNKQGSSLFFDDLTALFPLTETIKGIFNCLDGKGNIELENYYLPPCFWMESQVAPINYYSLFGGDPPFIAGFADGFIGTLVGIKDVVVGAGKLKAAWTIDLIKDSESLDEVIIPYVDLAKKVNLISSNLGTNYLIATSPSSLLKDDVISEQEKNAIISELKGFQSFMTDQVFSDANAKLAADVLRTLNSYLPEAVQVRKERVLTALYIMDPSMGPIDMLNTADEAQNIRTQTLEFLDFVVEITRPDDSQVRTEAYEQIKEELSTYFAEIKSLDNVARYRHGKIVFEVAIEVAGIVFTGGGANIATNAKRASKAMVEITDKTTDFIRVFRTKTGRHIDDLASLEKAFEGFKNINKLPLEVRKVLHGKGWPEDVLKVLDNDLNTPAFRERLTPQLVEAWEVLHKADVKDLANKINDIEFVGKYMDDFPDKNVAQEIADVGGYSKWSTGLNKLDNVLNKVDNLDLPNLKGKISELDDAAKIRFANDVGGLSDDAIRQLEDNFGLLDEWKRIDALEDAAKASRKPDWLKKIEQGNEFNRIRSSSYPYNEVYVKKSNGSGYYRLDSYKPGQEIVSRKYTQFDDINESTAFAYLQELKNKYPVNAEIANVPSSQSLLKELSDTGKRPFLEGQLILEIPVQKSGSISQSIINKADELGILIRDVTGTIY